MVTGGSVGSASLTLFLSAIKKEQKNYLRGQVVQRFVDLTTFDDFFVPLLNFCINYQLCLPCKTYRPLEFPIKFDGWSIV